MSKRVYKPRPVKVHLGPDGNTIEAIREQWLVEDRWWTGRPLRRHYFLVTTAEGANRVVFHDLVSGRWFTQRGA